MTKNNSKKPIRVVVGLGKSGIGAARLLESEGESILVLEKANQSEFKKLSNELTKKGISIQHNKDLSLNSFEDLRPKISSIVIGPGIPWDNKTLNSLREKGIKVESEISLAWQRLKHIPWIGITGTNGKTTVTKMLNHVLNKNKIFSLVGGNVGISASKIALNCKKRSNKVPKFLVMELSSYQLETLNTVTPEISIWTTFSPDHLERHKSLDKYFNIKKKLFENSSYSIYNQDDKYLRSFKSNLPKGIWVSSKGPGSESFPAKFWINSEGKVCEGNNEILDSSKLNIIGNHNIQNLLLVVAASRKIGLKGKEIERSLESFNGVEHRLEKIGEISTINVFNDSKATNYDAAINALKAIEAPSLIIAGGLKKSGDPKQWIEELSLTASAILLFGESKEELFDIIKKSKYKGLIYSYKNLEEAANASIDIALKLKVKNILFSPACASFDQYKNFEERGNHFKKIIRPFLE